MVNFIFYIHELCQTLFSKKKVAAKMEKQLQLYMIILGCKPIEVQINIMFFFSKLEIP
jgi:hypothetical protein